MTNKNYAAIDYLRAFITLLVVAHHSFIAYAKFAPSPTHAFTSKPYIWMALPVVDSQRWLGFDLLILFNDTFFMSMMFLLAGLFVWRSIERKGDLGYLHGRALRLGLPFVVAVTILSLLAYYPSYLLRGGEHTFGVYFHQWLSLDVWPFGPAWFISVLFGFDLLAVLLHKVAPSWIDALGRACASAVQRPARFFFGLLGISVLAYVSMRLPFGTMRWFSFGPVAIQASRVLLYLVYFLAGIGIGTCGGDRRLLATDGLLARRWPLWLAVAVVAFILHAGFMGKTMLPGASPTVTLQAMVGVLFAMSCAASCFFLLAVFVRFARRRIKLLDHFSASAYGIYLVHYSFVTWIQYALIDVNLSAIQKGLIAFAVALVLSWITIAGIRRMPPIDHILFSGSRSRNLA
jgi:peptidoglycan/LPS O-acetylase OafA/YrhL